MIKVRTCALFALAFSLANSSLAADIFVTDDTPDIFLNDTNIFNPAGFNWSVSTDFSGANAFSINWVNSFGFSVPVIVASPGASNFALTVDQNGVGIGTSTPFLPIHIAAEFPSVLLDDGIDQWYLGYINSAFAMGNLNGPTLPFAIHRSAPNFSFIIGANGNVGIGRGQPSTAVDVERSNSAANFQLTSFTDTANQAPQYIQRRAHGTSQSPQAVSGGDNLGLISFRGHNGNDFSTTRAGIAGSAAENWTPSGNGASLKFLTTQVGTTTPRTRLEITHNGLILVGGTQLDVPDYVFDVSYDLRSLDELDNYVVENKHLPGVPTSDEIRSEGLSLIDMQMNLLEKVEELTLYTLQQHKEIRALKQKINALEGAL